VSTQCYDIVARTHQARDEIATDVACCSDDHHSHLTPHSSLRCSAGLITLIPNISEHA